LSRIVVLGRIPSRYGIIPTTFFLDLSVTTICVYFCFMIRKQSTSGHDGSGEVVQDNMALHNVVIDCTAENMFLEDSLGHNNPNSSRDSSGLTYSGPSSGGATPTHSSMFILSLSIVSFLIGFPCCCGFS
jgi:hypothetical protein